MTTVKKKKQDEANAWLAVSDPRTGVKPWAERKQFHDINALENAHVYTSAPITSDAETAEGIALCKRFGIATDAASLDHAAVFQEGTVRTAALKAGGSVRRYNARNQLAVALRNLPEAEERRNRQQGWIAYQRIYANIVANAKALADLGGETVSIPEMLSSTATRYAV